MSETVAWSRSELVEHGRETIAKGSKSFALASLMFGREMQADVQMLYAWCRYCDDVIDGQDLGGDAPDATLTQAEQSARLERLKRNTERALNGEKIGVPAFDGFAIVAHKASMPRRFPMDLLDGFAMDAAARRYETLNDVMEYCYGVAGAVGVMMAIVMGVRDDDDETLDRACDLGLAFQLTNICRDVIADASAGRVYFPAEILRRHGVEPTASAVVDRANRERVAGAARDMLDVADLHYRSATEGLRRLPPRASAAIAAARNVYGAIGRIVRQRGAGAWDARAVVPPVQKTMLALTGVAAGAPQPILKKSAPMAPRGSLWKRPLR
ncbi:MAG: phytoene/squalene synthase family protein [Pseudomonadota bacterium]